MDINETLQQAISHHGAGRFHDAEALYLQILQADPRHPDANHNLGLMALQLGKAELGLPHLQDAWESDPSVDQYWLSLTECLLAMGHAQDALLVIEKAMKCGLNSPQARQLLARANGSYNKALPPASDIQEVMALANSARPAELEQKIRHLIELYPDWAFGWNTLGIALQQQGKDGVAALRQAVNLKPDDAEMHNNLGMLLKEQGMLDEALLSFRKALQIKPNYAKTHLNLAMVLQSKGMPNEAMASFRQALKIKPDFADAYCKLGMLLRASGQSDEALKNLRKAIKINPDLAEAHNTLGLVLQAFGQPDAALSSVRKALEIDPNYADAHVNLGLLFFLSEQYDEAQASFSRALEIAPDNAGTHLNFGLIRQAQGELDGALASFCQAIKIKPDLAEAHKGLSEVLFFMGHLDAAMASAKRALELKPDYSDAYLILGNIQKTQGKLDEALANYHKTLEIRPDTSQAYNNAAWILVEQGHPDVAVEYYRRALELKPQDEQIYSNFLFALSHNETIDARTLFAEHCRFAERFEAPLRANWPQHNNSRDPEWRLQVGFVSGDLCNHAVASFIESLLAHLAHYPQLSLHAYCNNLEDDVTQRLCSHFAHWNPVSHLSDNALADKIRADGIDILIDMSGHTAKHRLLTFAHKPAPVQASWMGYPGTTGLQAMDYYLADRYFLPPGQFDAQFTEKIVRMPASAPFLPFEGAPPVNPLPALDNGYVTFGSFNRPSKLSRSVIALWAQLLRALPDSRMVLGGMPEEGKYDTLIEWFAQEGIARERLDFHPRSGMDHYLGLYRQVDICLDTFPYNGGTTTCHALWMGVPTLTLAGATAAGRPGASILGHVGLEAFIAHDAADFVHKGLSWADNLAELSDIRAGLRERFAKSAMGQPAVVAAGVERALRIMWQRWCAGLPAESFEVGMQDMGNVMQEAGK